MPDGVLVRIRRFLGERGYREIASSTVPHGISHDNVSLFAVWFRGVAQVIDAFDQQVDEFAYAAGMSTDVNMY